MFCFFVLFCDHFFLYTIVSLLESAFTYCVVVCYCNIIPSTRVSIGDCAIDFVAIGAITVINLRH